MNSLRYRHSTRAAIILVLTLFTSMVWARLFPPCQNISQSLVSTDTIRYSVIDPISTQIREETWTIPQGVERTIESIQSDQGILTWIDKYRNSGDGYFTYVVQYRIYDPGRGSWRAGSWGPFSGYTPQLGQHQVKDGVVAWTSLRGMSPNPSDPPEQQVLYATYEPGFGTWILGSQRWVTTKGGPEVLRVKNGVVAWPMYDPDTGKASDEWDITVLAAIFDHEIKQWISVWQSLCGCGGCGHDCGLSHPGFDWIEILEDTAQVHARFSAWASSTDYFFSYVPSSHKWLGGLGTTSRPSPNRRANFVAWPEYGVVPFWTWFWDLSTGLEPPNASYLWNLTPTNTLTERSPAFRYTTAGLYNVLQNIAYSNPPPYAFQSPITALAPGPTGSININNNAAYANSYNVTLSLNYEATATEMRFKQIPGLGGIWAWTNWEPVASAKAWTLSGIYVGDSPDGTHTVSVQYRTYWGVESAVYEDSIGLDITPPAGTLTLNGGVLRAKNPIVQAVWSASDIYSGMQMSYSAFNEEDGYGFWSPWENYQPSNRNFTFSGNGGRKTVLVRFKDAGGNITQKEAYVNMDWRMFLPMILRP